MSRDRHEGAEGTDATHRDEGGGTVPQTQTQSSSRARFRTVFISDLHLGTPRAQAEQALDFLRSTECDHLFLVGDVIDNWALKRSWFWDQSHSDVIQTIMRKAASGTRVTYIPGNHDEHFRDFCGQSFASVDVRREALHVLADGRRLLVLHGDKFDGVVLYAPWLAHIGDVAYGWAIRGNALFNRARRHLGMPYWSLSAFLKRHVKRAVEFGARFEDAAVREAQLHGADGIVCGHIHTAERRVIDGIEYCNDGDWVESCTALVEHEDGRLELLDWSRDRERLLGRTGSEAGPNVVPLRRVS